MSLKRRLITFFIGLAAFSTTGHAIPLDWDGVTCAPGTLGITTLAIAVPEVNPAWGTAVSCLVAAALILRHGANVRRK